ncbi:type II toxin-antitoxin system RelE family toxin [Pelistega europaea]|uniref:Type II toxin-antitoxin system RelE/ParE family toxin n=1 Tax=Pelistega europaea TaxID=106147 RepID=A0A7Y4P4L6_9BURK|nr:type II toxin-antitoxin system RelE/ParE family toxin [Pelistega europaea]NOL48838.1 type II toxin-antitoxin system RelE/ParE family toxin [Pelistega europaea]
MTYNLVFTQSAQKEWQSLDNTVKTAFKKKLTKVLEMPHIEKNRLSGYAGFRYKIKLRTVGYRLLYEVIDDTVTVEVIAIGKRDTIYNR